MGSARRSARLPVFTHRGNGFARRQAGQPRRAQCASGLSAFVGHHRHSENIGQQLGPERLRAPRPPASTARSVSALFNACRPSLIPKLTLQHRVAELRAQAGVVMPQKMPRASGSLCGVRSPEIGQEERRVGFILLA